MAQKIGPLDVYKLLPQTNCGQCGENNCLAFATKLVERTVTLEKCPPLFEAKYKDKLEKLRKLLRPPVLEVSFGVEPKILKIGGKLVMYRHELRYTNPTAIIIDVSDDMDDEKILEKIRRIEEFSYTYIGKPLKLDGIAIRCVSGDTGRFSHVVSMVIENTKLPIVLCTLDAKIMDEALKVAHERRPLIYAATEGNWKEMGELSIKYNVPLVASAPGNLKMLKTLTKTLSQMEIEELVIDPGSYFGEGINEIVNNYTMIRRAACKMDDKLLGYPIMGIPLVVWAKHEGPATVAKWRETLLASMLLLRYADILIMSSIDPWVILPVLILRENIYTDPVKPVSVEAGLRTFGTVNENSPVMFTTNFALTYFTVASDIESNKINCYLLVVDTEGLSVESSVAGRKLTADKVAEALKESGVENKVKHRKLIIPGLAARLRGELEDLTGWEILVGPKDSSGIPKFLEQYWKV